MAYKQAKEAFVAHNNGSSVAHVQAVSLVGWSSYILYASLVTKRPSPIKDYLTAFLPLLLGQTIFSSHPIEYNVLLLTVALLFRLTQDVSPEATPQAAKEPRHRPFLTTWRAHMMLMTTIAILAVDFPIFPREFGKTEDWGTSLMDVGVGSFVFSQGLAASSSTTPAKLGKTLKKCVPVVGLGMIRVIMVKGVDYPEHVTEYGVHWNFFFTLAAMPVLAALLSPLRRRVPGLALVALLLAIHSFALYLGLEDWVMAPETTSRRGLSLLVQNKEGIVSLPGYLAIYLIGAEIGRVVVLRNVIPREDSDANMARMLALYAGVSWAMLFIFRQFGVAVSRRLTNAPYVLWTTSFNATFLLGYLLIERYAFPRGISGAGKVPPLLEAVNKNGLAVFLLANLLTGLVNVSMETMYASDGVAVAVLFVYTAALSGVAWGMRGVRVGF